MKPDEGVIWIPGDTQLEPLTVTVGIVGEKESEISGENLQDGMPVAIPPKRGDTERRRRFGLSLF